MMTRGRCLCEQVVYEIQGSLGPVFHCHCLACRRWHGAAFRTRASIRSDQFSWIQGQSLVSTFQSSQNVTKHFCSACGSPLISTYTHVPDVIGLPLGGLEQNPDIDPEGHIFVAHKASWHVITDDLPQYEEWPENEDRVRQTEPSRG